MKLKQYLVDGDPVARERELDARDAQTIRARILVDARNQPATAPALWWLRPAAVAGGLAVCLAAGIGIGLRINDREPLGPATVVGRPLQGRQSPPPRQLQFATPGGTRIVWTFHEKLEL